ncbi:metal-dependent hydrolase [Rahnella sp. L72c]|uniref:Metal-dependent hydrolase n=1 Tax=Rahnella perminowiae TaxID=2816244 RepID=A0ABS6L6V7_9GAMM|nr:metal-dependent hydrolase [Rahnella perminowiae]MBU9837539.1 metal-dependent hydrolase [Rahnella perminowiae]
MDSVSQLVLGAAVGIAVMGKRAPVWKSALAGAVCGTLPDLDVFYDHGDVISNMTLHRTESHALFYLTLISPLMAWLMAKLFSAGQHFRRWWGTVWLALITHPLLDVMTVYGTQLGIPFTHYPFAVGSIFIIDPLYTLPLITGVGLALYREQQRGIMWNNVLLGISCLYLACTMIEQYQVTRHVGTELQRQNIDSTQVLVTPTPLNSLVWRVVVMSKGSYGEGFTSLLHPDSPIRFRFYPRGEALYEAHKDNPFLARVAWFSHGFFSVKEQGGHILVSDLRMGQEPDYTFVFDLGDMKAGAPPALPVKVASARPSATKMWEQFRQALDVD